MMKVTGVVMAGITLLLAGCANTGILESKPVAQLFDRNGVDLVSEPTDRRTTFFKDRDGQERFCRAPGPDFAVTASEGVSFGLPTVPMAAGRSGAVSEDSSQGGLALGGAIQRS